MTKKTTEKDTREKMAANMKMFEDLVKNIEDQEEYIPGVGKESQTIGNNFASALGGEGRASYEWAGGNVAFEERPGPWRD